MEIYRSLSYIVVIHSRSKSRLQRSLQFYVALQFVTARSFDLANAFSTERSASFSLAAGGVAASCSSGAESSSAVPSSWSRWPYWSTSTRFCDDPRADDPRAEGTSRVFSESLFFLPSSYCSFSCRRRIRISQHLQKRFLKGCLAALRETVPNMLSRGAAEGADGTIAVPVESTLARRDDVVTCEPLLRVALLW